MDKCPDCGALTLMHPDFSPWCRECEWNLDPAEAAQKLTLLDRKFRAFSESIGAGLLDSLGRQQRIDDLHHSETLAGRLAAALSLLVLSFAALLLVTGAAILAMHYTEPSLIFLGLVCIALAVVARPRRISLPTSARPLSDYPALKKLRSVQVHR